MSNRIVDVQVTQKRWGAAEAELWVAVVPERRTAATEIRGRLVGPRCPGLTTIEVAYPLRPLPRSEDALIMRVVIPDPLPWEPERPYCYEGVVELWEDGQRCDQRPLRVLGKANSGSA